jgi:hypothetical protein
VVWFIGTALKLEDQFSKFNQCHGLAETPSSLHPSICYNLFRLRYGFCYRSGIKILR